MTNWTPCPKCNTGTMKQIEDQYGHFLRCADCALHADLQNGSRDEALYVLRSLRSHFAGEDAVAATGTALAA